MSTRTESRTFAKQERVFPAGAVVFHEGDAPGSMYVIQSGKVKITRRVGTTEATLAVLPRGEFFGEMAIINDQPRSCTATALEDSNLLVIEPPVFEAMIRSNSEIAVRIIKKLVTRLNRADRMIELLLYRELNHKVLHFISEQARKRGRPEVAGTAVPLSVAEIVAGVRLGEDVVIDVLNNLVSTRLVSFGFDDSIVIPDEGQIHDFLELLEIKESQGEERTPTGWPIQDKTPVIWPAPEGYEKPKPP